MRLVVTAVALLSVACSTLSGPLGQRIVDGPWQLDAVSADGRTLLVSTRFDGCEEYRGTSVEERADEVRVRVRLAQPLGEPACTEGRHVRQVHVTLDEPLGERHLVGCGDEPPGCVDLANEAAGLSVEAPLAHGALAGGAAIVTTGVPATMIGLDGATGAVTWTRPVSTLAGATALRALVPAGDLLVIEDRRGRLYAIDPATGQVRWQRLAVSQLGALPNTTVVVGDLVTSVGPGGTVSGIGLRDGVERWTVRPEGEHVFALAASEGTVLALGGRRRVGDDPGTSTLTALDAATGAIRWTYAAPGGPAGLAAVAGIAVMQVWGGMYGVAVPDGTERWRRVPFDHFAVRLRAGDNVVLLDEDGTLARLDLATGAIAARYPDDGALRRSLVVDQGLLVAATPDGRLVARDSATGAVRWIAPIGAHGATPAIGGGLVVVPTALGALGLDARDGRLVWSWTRGPEAFVDAASSRPAAR